MIKILQANGRIIDLNDPHPADIDFGSVAHSLSLQCRFNGHTRVFYSVGMHCLLVARILAEQGLGAWLVRKGLLHDAHEAYVGDISTPVKHALQGLSEIVYQLDIAISRAAGLPPSYLHHRHPEVHEADLKALRIERAYLLPDNDEWPAEGIEDHEVGWLKDLIHLQPHEVKARWLAALQ